MILLTRLDGKQIMMNDSMFEIAEETPDTIITMSNGHSYIVREKLAEIMRYIEEYQNKIRSGKSR